MRSRRRLLRRAGLAAVVSAVVSLGCASGATASTIDGSLGSTVLRGGVVTTTLSLPASASGTTVDASSVLATVGGRSAAVDTTRVPAERRVVVLLIDTSGSMGSGGLDGAKGAAKALLGQLPSAVEVGLVSFSDRPRTVVGPTTDRSTVLTALDRLRADGETSLYDGVIAAVQTAGTTGDRRVLLLSDGGDTVSVASLGNAVRALGAGVSLDAVAFRTDESQAKVLGALATAGHGRVANTSTPQALAAAFAVTGRQIASQLRLQVRVPAGGSGSAPLVVTARVGQDTVVARSVVDLGGTKAGGGAVASASGLPSRAMPTSWLPTTPWLLVGFAFVLFLVLALLLLAPQFESSSKKSVRQLELYSLSGRREQVVESAQPSTGLVVEAAQGLVRRSGKEAALSLRLDRAGMSLRPAEWLVLQCALALGAAVLLTVVGGSLWWALPGVGLAVLVTEVYARVRVRRRLRAFEQQLPDVLTLVASSLATGFALNHSLDAVAQDASEPVRSELYRALAETRIGADLTDALDRLADRMDSETMRWTTMAMRIQQRVGGNLAETLRTTAGTLREREQLRRMARGLSAEGRLSAYILIALPIGLFCFMLFANHDYVALLWSSLLGWLMLGVAVAGLVVGSFWMSRVVKVEA